MTNNTNCLTNLGAGCVSMCQTMKNSQWRKWHERDVFKGDADR